MVLYGTAYKLISSVIAGSILANGAVALRFAARWVGGIKVTVDDYLMLAALVLYWGMGLGGILMSQNGLGRPLAEIPTRNLVVFLKVQFASSFLYTMTIFFTKSSILTMYWRVLPSERVRRGVYICGALVWAWTIAVCSIGGLACIPVRKAWAPHVEGACIDWAPFYYGVQIPNILTDVFIVVLPLREVFGLTLTKRQRNILIGIFSIAGLTVIFDVIHLVATLEFSRSRQDFTVSVISPSIWTAMVPAVGIFATCLTNLRPLFRYLSDVHTHSLRRAKLRKEGRSSELTESQERADPEKLCPSSRYAGGPDEPESFSNSMA